VKPGEHATVPVAPVNEFGLNPGGAFVHDDAPPKENVPAGQN
jgi:hypothetical protein